MLADDITPIKARIIALQAGLALLVLVILANGTLNFFGFAVPFLFVPLIVIYFWPQGSDPSLTYFLLFLVGLVHDFLSGGSPGIWSLIFLLGLVITRPYLSGKEIGLSLFWFGFTVWMGVLAVLFLLLDYWGQDHIAFGNIILQITTAILLFPLLYVVRYLLKSTLVGRMD